ncbi:MAG: serine protease [Deltaproteobacteria bacterium]|nr:serine protease [Deltaproteobacteria bacterium]
MHVKSIKTIFRVLLFLAVAVVITPVYSADTGQEVEKSVVQIHTSQRRPDLFNPWSKMPTNEISGTGVIITGNRILTNAHVVMFASQVYVQPYQSSD